MGRLLLYSFLIFLSGLSVYALFFISWLYAKLLGLPLQWVALIDVANALMLLAFAGAGIDFGTVTLTSRRREIRSDPVESPKVSVGMTAYNDELSIGGAVRDFKKQKEVVGIVVIDNNCVDRTAEEAKLAGAKVIREPVQGYGASCIRALKEARKKGNLVCLVEGDQTYFASDLKKLLSYIENVDMVVGTRTTMEIVAPDSQVTPFIQIGNVFVAKLLQLRFLGKLRLTDVGCTYRLIRPEALDKIMGDLKVTGNHFCTDIMISCLKRDFRVIECPIAFKKRVGISKGVGDDFYKGIINGLQIIWLVLKS